MKRKHNECESFRSKIELNRISRERRGEWIYRLVDWTGKSLRWALIMRSTKEIGTHVQMCIYIWNAMIHARWFAAICKWMNECVWGMKIAEHLTYFQENCTMSHCTTNHDHVPLNRNDSHSVTVIEKKIWMQLTDEAKTFYNVRSRKLLEFSMCLSRIAQSGTRWFFFRKRTHIQ